MHAAHSTRSTNAFMNDYGKSNTLSDASIYYRSICKFYNFFFFFETEDRIYIIDWKKCYVKSTNRLHIKITPNRVYIEKTADVGPPLGGCLCSCETLKLCQHAGSSLNDALRL